MFESCHSISIMFTFDLCTKIIFVATLYILPVSRVTIRRAVCARLIISVIAHNRSLSLMFSSIRLFSLNLIFPNVLQYPKKISNILGTFI